MEYRPLKTINLLADSERQAWDAFANEFARIVRKLPPESRLIWRKTPEVFEDRNFGSDKTEFRIVARAVECIGEGELPTLRNDYENELGIGVISPGAAI